MALACMSNRFAIVACCILLQQSASFSLHPSFGRSRPTLTPPEVSSSHDNGFRATEPYGENEGKLPDNDFPANQFHDDRMDHPFDEMPETDAPKPNSIDKVAEEGKGSISAIPSQGKSPERLQAQEIPGKEQNNIPTRRPNSHRPRSAFPNPMKVAKIQDRLCAKQPDNKSHKPEEQRSPSSSMPQSAFPKTNFEGERNKSLEERLQEASRNHGANDKPEKALRQEANEAAAERWEAQQERLEKDRRTEKERLKRQEEETAEREEQIRLEKEEELRAGKERPKRQEEAVEREKEARRQQAREEQIRLENEELEQIRGERKRFKRQEQEEAAEARRHQEREEQMKLEEEELEQIKAERERFEQKLEEENERYRAEQAAKEAALLKEEEQQHQMKEEAGLKALELKIENEKLELLLKQKTEQEARLKALEEELENERLELLREEEQRLQEEEPSSGFYEPHVDSPFTTIDKVEEDRSNINLPDQSGRFKVSSASTPARPFREENFQRWRQPPPATKLNDDKGDRDPIGETLSADQNDKSSEGPKRSQMRKREPLILEGQPDRLDTFEASQEDRSMRIPYKNQKQQSPPRQERDVGGYGEHFILDDQSDRLDRFMQDPSSSKAPQADRSTSLPNKFQKQQSPSRHEQDASGEHLILDDQSDRLDRFMQDPSSSKASPADRSMGVPKKNENQKHVSPTRQEHDARVEGQPEDRFARDPLHSDASQAQRFIQDPSRFTLYQRTSQESNTEKQKAADLQPDMLDSFVNGPAHSDALQAQRYKEDPSSFTCYKHPSKRQEEKHTTMTDQPDTLDHFMQDPADSEASQAERFRDDPINFQRMQQIDRYRQDPSKFEVWRTKSDDNGKRLDQPRDLEERFVQDTSGSGPQGSGNSKLDLINYPSHGPSHQSLQGPDPNLQQWLEVSNVGPVTPGLPETWSLGRQDPNFQFMVNLTKFQLWKQPSSTDVDGRDKHVNNAGPGRHDQTETFVNTPALAQQQQQIGRLRKSPIYADVRDKSVKNAGPNRKDQGESSTNTPAFSQQQQQIGRLRKDSKNFQQEQSPSHTSQKGPDKTVPGVQADRLQRWQRGRDTSTSASQPDQASGFEAPTVERRHRSQDASVGPGHADQLDGFVDSIYGSHAPAMHIPDPTTLVPYRRTSPTRHDEPQSDSSAGQPSEGPVKPRPSAKIESTESGKEDPRTRGTEKSKGTNRAEVVQKLGPEKGGKKAKDVARGSLVKLTSNPKENEKSSKASTSANPTRKREKAKAIWKSESQAKPKKLSEKMENKAIWKSESQAKPKKLSEKMEKAIWKSESQVKPKTLTEKMENENMDSAPVESSVRDPGSTQKPTGKTNQLPKRPSPDKAKTSGKGFGHTAKQKLPSAKEKENKVVPASSSTDSSVPQKKPASASEPKTRAILLKSAQSAKLETKSSVESKDRRKTKTKEVAGTGSQEKQKDTTAVLSPEGQGSSPKITPKRDSQKTPNLAKSPPKSTTTSDITVPKTAAKSVVGPKAKTNMKLSCTSKKEDSNVTLSDELLSPESRPKADPEEQETPVSNATKATRQDDEENELREPEPAQEESRTPLDEPTYRSMETPFFASRNVERQGSNFDVDFDPMSDPEWGPGFSPRSSHWERPTDDYYDPPPMEPWDVPPRDDYGPSPMDLWEMHFGPPDPWDDDTAYPRGPAGLWADGPPPPNPIRRERRWEDMRLTERADSEVPSEQRFYPMTLGPLKPKTKVDLEIFVPTEEGPPDASTEPEDDEDPDET